MEFDGVYKLRSLSDDFSKLMKTMGMWNLSQSITFLGIVTILQVSQSPTSSW